MTNLKNAADVFDMAGKLGLDLPLLQDVIISSSGSSAISQAMGTQIDAEAAKHLQALMRKDMEHFTEALRDRALDPSELRCRGIDSADQVVELASKLQRQSAGR